jgi:hypothetical protein
VLVRASLLAAVIVVAIRCVPISVVARLTLRQQRRRGTRREVSPTRAAALVEMVSARMPGSTCLTRALVLCNVLYRQGDREAQLIVGIQREAARFASHAWVRYRERILIGGSHSDQYLPLARLCEAGLVPAD